MSQTEKWVSKQFKLTLLGAVASLFCVACGDTSRGVGDKGNLVYSVYADYDLVSELRDAKLATRVENVLHVQLTANGVRNFDQPWRIDHRLSPSDGGTVRTESTTNWNKVEGSANAPDAYLIAQQEGTFQLQSWSGDALVDTIDLTFDALDRLDLITAVRGPWEEKFEKRTGQVIEVEEGTQASFLAIPVNDQGERLVGGITIQASANPEWMVVPGQNIVGLYENGYWRLNGPFTVYFIEPGEVTITMDEPNQGVSGQQTFLVTPVDKQP